MEQTWIDFSRSTLSAWWGAFLWKGPRDSGNMWEGALTALEKGLAPFANPGWL